MKMSSPLDIPKTVIAEINSLYCAWERWHPDTKLDLSRSKGVPVIPTGSKPEDLFHMVRAKGRDLLCLLFFVLCHEYGHLLMDHNKDIRQTVRRTAGDLLKRANCSRHAGNPHVSRPCWLCKYSKTFTTWQSELGADIIALDTIRQVIPDAKDDIVIALAMLSIIQNLIETYSLIKYKKCSRSHPVSFHRYMAWMYHITRFPGWGLTHMPHAPTQVEAMLISLYGNPKLHP